MISSTTLRGLLFVTLSGLWTIVKATPCVGFDTNWGLYVFGLEHDVSLGPVGNWAANPLSSTTLSKTGRPPFNGTNTQCFFAQFFNALYVLDGDSTQPSNIHIYSFETQSWSTQQIDAAGTDPATLTAVLDRDTNVFFALSGSQLYSLDMGTLAQSDGARRAWNFVQAPEFTQNNKYPKPVMGLAQNHIHFLNLGTDAFTKIFVIHFSYMQPELQAFAPIEAGGSGYPSAFGHTASIFKGFESVQTKFAFLPEDGSATYVFDVISNTTQKLQAPSNKATVMVAASQREIVQITTSGEIFWLPYNPDDGQANYGAVWSKLALSIPVATGTNSTRPSSAVIETSPTSTQTGSSSAAPPPLSQSALSTSIFTLGLAFTGLFSLF
ncbi:hypothetical protein FRC14_002578 [Serendipita sp. 396]|nr:hypothetical protein FRC14_002578 [Serendipita sp. 396]KAG8786147.1 hypothetical protein FRC15_012035 [Serendipita sp. 397]KAG8828842.1 hypothetical protein FRC19_000230 [Serendipita sp. 401]KAG8868368.1 hypothetical protein FRC20_003529 [Serendipita sp. 405]KAG9058636.1 hypothetical protein FS842_005973 [Serendipita sp. 407]